MLAAYYFLIMINVIISCHDPDVGLAYSNELWEHLCDSFFLMIYLYVNFSFQQQLLLTVLLD